MRYAVFLISISFALAGCASLSPPAQNISAKQNICPDAPVIASLQKRSEELKTLQGTALIKMQFQGNRREIAGRAIVIIKRPDQFRFEILGPFNQISMIALYNGNSLSLLSFQENKVYRDYPFPIDVSMLPQYLMGLPAGEVRSQKPALEGFNQGSEARSQNENTHPLSLSPCYVNSEDEQIFINHEGDIREITSSAIRDDSHTIKVSMGSYKEVDGFNIPFAISISSKASGFFIRYENVELNQHISNDLFNLPQQPIIEDIIPAP
jgi:outer membrane lipoprotein-sorting protein